MLRANMFASGIKAVNHGGMQAGRMAVTTCIYAGLHFLEVCRVASHHRLVHLSFSYKGFGRNSALRLLAGDELSGASH